MLSVGCDALIANGQHIRGPPIYSHTPLRGLPFTHFPTVSVFRIRSFERKCRKLESVPIQCLANHVARKSSNATVYSPARIVRHEESLADFS
jgi:hypothetical protein